jgi:hypothetical protein
MAAYGWYLVTSRRFRQRWSSAVEIDCGIYGLDSKRYHRDDLVFDVRDAGPPDGSVVVLLHGFPQRNDSWNAVIDRLAAQGYRCLAPNQRGYSPGARPSAAATTACPHSSPTSAH